MNDEWRTQQPLTPFVYPDFTQEVAPTQRPTPEAIRSPSPSYPGPAESSVRDFRELRRLLEELDPRQRRISPSRVPARYRAWCNMVQDDVKLLSMAEAQRTVRQSVSIPVGVARRVRALAKTRKTSANRVLVDLIEAGLQSKEAEKERFFALASRLAETRDSAERRRLKEELARMTFGD